MTRQTARLVIVFLVLAAAVGPAVMSLSLSYSVVREREVERLQRLGLEVLQEVETSYHAIMQIVGPMAGHTAPECGPGALGRLTEAVYTQRPVVQAGLFTAEDWLYCTNLGPINIDLPIREGEILTGDEAAWISRVEDSMAPILGGALALHVEASDLTGARVLVDPQIFVDRFNPELLHQDASLELSLLNGAVLAARGPGEVTGDGETVTEISDLLQVQVRITVPEGFFITRWAPIAVSVMLVAILTSVLLIVFLMRLARYRLSLSAEIDQALRKREFVPYYQPVVDGVTGQPVGIEVLLRWLRRDGALMTPDAFIALVEETGPIAQLTMQTMETVRDEIGPLASRYGLEVAFNISAGHFSQPGFADDVLGAFNGGRLPATRVVLELTERQPLSDLKNARDVIGKLQTAGVRVALDDAGTGHGGLAYLKALGLDIMKIDRMFVEGLGSDSPSAAVTTALVELARRIGMRVVAEGVETMEQKIALQALGVDQMQGFHFAKPMHRDELIKYLKQFDEAAA